MDLNIHKSLLINLAALFCMIPYFAPFPTESDVQYPVIILCGLIFLLDLFKNNIRFNNFELYFLFLSILSLVYINPYVDFEYLFTKRVALLSAFFIFYVFSRYWAFINPKYFLAGVLINFLACIVQAMSPEIFEYLQVFVGRAFTMSGFSYNPAPSIGWRGLTGLSAEPAYLGGLSIVYFFVGYILWNERRISKKIFLIFSAIALTLNMVSLTATAAIMSLSVIISFIMFSKISLLSKIFYLIGSLFALLLLFNILEDSYRSFKMLELFITDPISLIRTDYSSSLRLMSIAVGFESIMQGNIFGNGVGTLSYVATDIMEGSNVKNIFHPGVMEQGRERESFSALGLYISELGILFIILIGWLYSRPMKSNYTNIVRFPIFLFLASAFSLLFPPFWMLMAATDKRAIFFQNKFS